MLAYGERTEHPAQASETGGAVGAQPASMLAAATSALGGSVLQRKLSRRRAGGGAPLADATRERMVGAFGQPFDDVALHRDGLAEARGARAVTVGSDVHISGAVDVESADGQQTLGHELTHVIQQRGAAAPASAAGAQRVNDPRLEAEADQVGTQAAAGGSVAGAVQGTLAHAAAQHQDPVWHNGPTVERKTKGHRLEEYVAWVKQVEASYSSKEEVLRRLRRLYYSNFTGGAGGKFDRVIPGYGHNADTPLESPPVPLETLNRLYETNFIITPRGSQVDVSHLFAGLDVSVTGASTEAGVAEVRYGVDFRGVLTWAGDLASWFVEWQSKLKQKQSAGESLDEAAQENLLKSLVNNKVAKDDLLGDMDAQSLAKQNIHTDIIPSYGMAPPAIINSLTNSVSGMLEAYYGQGGRAAPAQGVTAVNRFAQYVVSARPVIPHQRIQESPLKVALAADAKQAIYTAIKNTAGLFLSEGYTAGEADSVRQYDNMLWKIAWYFDHFLRTGLASGDAPWPI